MFPTHIQHVKGLAKSPCFWYIPVPGWDQEEMNIIQSLMETMQLLKL